MKEEAYRLIEKYLKIFPDEVSRLEKLKEYLNINEEITDWNNFDGHIVAGGFLYSKKDKKFFLLFHKDLEMYLYPGGHIDLGDKDIYSAAEREVKEESGVNKVEAFKIDGEVIPIDIDTHMIPYNQRLNLSSHYHFDFRYLFLVDEMFEVMLDEEEANGYKWVEIDEVYNDPNFHNIAKKIEGLLEAE